MHSVRVTAAPLPITTALYGRGLARMHVEVGSGADVAFIRWKAIKHQRDFQLIARSSLQTIPTLQTPRDQTATIFKRRRLNAGDRVVTCSSSRSDD